MSKITYYRGTTFPIAVTYTPPAGIAGATALFTVKTSQSDTDPVDAAAIVKKDITLTGNAGSSQIAPGDVADTVTPGTYFYDLKVLDANGAIYPIAADKFELKATPTNRLT
jgi:hypothetical protein